MVELRLLRSFVTIVEEGSITRAARDLHMAQQSLSRQVQALESELGGALLRRSPSGVTPTPAGEVLFQEARRLIAQSERLSAAVRDAVSGRGRELRVGFLGSLAPAWMPYVLREMRQAHPALQVTARDGPIDVLVEGLRGGGFDAVVTRPPLVADLRAETVHREAVGVLLPGTHRLADRCEVSLACLAAEDWVMPEVDAWPPWAEHHVAVFARAGFTPRVTGRGTSVQNLVALVAAGIGIARLARSAVATRPDGVVFIPLVDEHSEVALVTRHGDPAHRTEILREILDRWPPDGGDVGDARP